MSLQRLGQCVGDRLLTIALAAAGPRPGGAERCGWVIEPGVGGRGGCARGGGAANYGVNPTRLAPQTAAVIRAWGRGLWRRGLHRSRRAGYAQAVRQTLAS